MLDGPNHKRIFPYVRPLPPTPNFPIMIYPAQIVWPLQSVSYSLPRPWKAIGDNDNDGNGDKRRN
jgi:hypothetical protein